MEPQESICGVWGCGKQCDTQPRQTGVNSESDESQQQRLHPPDPQTPGERLHAYRPIIPKALKDAHTHMDYHTYTHTCFYTLIHKQLGKS